MMFLDSLLFILLSSLAVISSLFVIGSRSPIYSVLFLVLVFFNVVGLLIFIEAEFIGIIFLIVYVGAIAILFLFVVMMLNLKNVKLNENYLRYLPIVALFSVIFFLQIFSILQGPFLYIDNETLKFLVDFLNTTTSTFNFWSNKIEFVTNIEQLGFLLYTHYFFLFLVSGMVLLVAMIGAIVLTLHQSAVVKRQKLYEQIDRNFMKSIKFYR